ncbi:MAG: GNAT family N-acetyltransferase [Paracoccus sp. (in: a-proteobacteria)]|nr:GNAT family N-acetyltransferase [Paracoccus sp. (in: a-proteobacteria)]
MSNCACPRHHPNRPCPDTGSRGEKIALAPPLYALTGRLICTDMAEMLLALDLLPDHIAASRAEPGCLRFDIVQSDAPLIWHLTELFADEAAFAAHQARSRNSRWGRDSAALRRDFSAGDSLAVLRPETRRDIDGIAALNQMAFGGTDEADLVARLRAEGDLPLSLVAESGGVILGHVALSPLRAAGPAMALAPLAVHPAVQGRGIGAALVRAALDAFGDHSVVVLGDPAYYRRFGFAPADLQSPYAGPHLQIVGPPLPQGSIIRHAPAFAAL